MLKEYWWLIIILAIGVIIIVLLGTFWHNLYIYTKENYFNGLISPVNESFWEHLKIIIYPILIFFLFLYVFSYHIINNAAVALLLSTIGAIVFLMIAFYAYTRFNVNNSILWVDIVLYVISIIVAMVIMFYVLTARYFGDVANYACIALYIILIFFSMLTTYIPPCDCCMWKKPHTS